MQHRLMALFVILIAMPALAQTTPEQPISFAVEAGQFYSTKIDHGLMFSLDPAEGGWQINVVPEVKNCLRDCADDDCYNMTDINLPLHGVNSTQLYGWHFRNADNTAPNDGSTIAPGEERDFVYALSCSDQTRIMDSYMCLTGSRQDCEDTGNIVVGHGLLTVNSHELTPPEKGQMADFVKATFTLTLYPPEPLKNIDGVSVAPLGYSAPAP